MPLSGELMPCKGYSNWVKVRTSIAILVSGALPTAKVRSYGKDKTLHKV